ncbi:E3 ubiquitin-protein ligase XIAP-like [Mercenaria mercenaria]|uniref:E3 ubiquitin-protein ligase XIAP-like n=1 Tax=Mercenaria mercenaria TaxID=6596 RepID=UPI00234E7BF6|nr:E3 ubiquitin-protein ligase XIAP-like [Mercenaria mercenaria]
MKKYLSELENNRSSNDKLFNYEWARFCSFQTYPKSSIVSPVRLAKSGFYYTGNGDEAICFFCRVNIKEWSEEETVAETHHRLSPNCDLINGRQTSNVPIHAQQQNKDFASGGPQDVQRENYNHRRRNVPIRSSQNTEQNPEPTDTTENTSINNESSTLRYSYLKQASDYPTEQIERFPGITDERPKHPDYALKSERLSSFRKGTLFDNITPETLAASGFFYTGTKDNVKCFFCGGELRDWKLGDNPWIEHARWFHNCAYFKQCKGVEFVNFCRITNVDYLPQSQALEVHGSSLNHTNEVHDQSIKDLNSVAAKLVLGMGYTQELVEKISQTHKRTLQQHRSKSTTTS